MQGELGKMERLGWEAPPEKRFLITSLQSLALTQWVFSHYKVSFKLSSGKHLFPQALRLRKVSKYTSKVYKLRYCLGDY